MILTQFNEWINKSKKTLEADFVTTEIITKYLGNQPSPDKSLAVDHQSENCLGRVVVWESFQMEFEVVNYNTGEQLLWKYIEKIDENCDFDDILTQYFDTLFRGLKP